MAKATNLNLALMPQVPLFPMTSKSNSIEIPWSASEHLNPPIARALGGNALLHSNAPRTSRHSTQILGQPDTASSPIPAPASANLHGRLRNSLKSDCRLLTRGIFSGGIYLQLTDFHQTLINVRPKSNVSQSRSIANLSASYGNPLRTEYRFRDCTRL